MQYKIHIILYACIVKKIHYVMKKWIILFIKTYFNFNLFIKISSVLEIKKKVIVNWCTSHILKNYYYNVNSLFFVDY